MFDVLNVVLPVFIVLAFGYIAVWAKVMTAPSIDALMKFAQTFAIPCLLFRAISTLDLQTSLNLPLLFSFYAGATIAFIVGIFGARYVFGRSWEDCVAIAFCCLFSNTLLLGLPITERAYGPEGLIGNYAIIAFHAPFGYMVGITAMELVRAKGTPASHLPAKVGKAVFSNAIVVGIGLGFIANLTNLSLPTVFTDAVDIIGRAALPAALFGLGGVLFRYRPEGDIRVIAFVCVTSMGLHPLVVYVLGTTGDLSTDALRSGLITAAVAPGANAYIFANMYGTAKRVAASSVLFGTALSIVTTTLWITLLP